MDETFEVVSYEKERHRSYLESYWKEYGWPVVPEEILPKIGLVVQNSNNIPLCAGFIYRTDSIMCLFEWIIADPKLDKELRAKALILLITKVKDVIVKLGFKHIITQTKNKGLIDKLKNSGFKETDVGMSNMIYMEV